MRGLIVRHILPRHTQAIDRVVHQSDQPMLCGDGGCEYQQLAGVLLVVEHHLFAPVAEQVGLEVGVLLCAVDARASKCLKINYLVSAVAVPFADSVAV